MFREFWLRLKTLLRSRQLERDLDDELAYHLEMRKQAGVEARGRFGSATMMKERCRELWTFPSLDRLQQDVRYALRGMRRNPVLTSVALLSLALGIGANTAIFSLCDSILMDLLPVEQPERLFLIAHRHKSGAGTAYPYPGFEHFRDQNRSMSGLFAYNLLDNVKLNVGQETEVAAGALVSGTFHQVLGVAAVLGRTFSPDDDRSPGADTVTVISHRFWERRFQRDPSVIGRVIRLNNMPFTIIGVTPPEFFGIGAGTAVDVWIPMSMQAEFGQPHRNKRTIWWLNIGGRLKPGVTPQQAAADLDTIYHTSIYPSAAQDRERIELQSLSRGFDDLRGRYSRPLLALMCVVAVVLLIACANLANLLMARSLSRQKEMAIRTAIGANRTRLVRQLLTESLLLTAGGGAAGLLFAQWGRDFLLQWLNNGPLPHALNAGLSGRVLAFTAAVSLLTGVLFGLAPAIRASQVDPLPALKEETRVKGASPLALGRLMLIAQVTFTVLLLIGAGLFSRTLSNLRSMELGFDRRGMILLTVEGGSAGYDKSRLAQRYERILAEVRAASGIEIATIARHRPISSGGSAGSIGVLGGARKGAPRDAESNIVDPSFFETLRIPLLRGRYLQETDGPGQKVAVVNETMARLFFDEGNALGRKIMVGGSATEASEIVGVIADAKYHSLREKTTPMIYVPYRQVPSQQLTRMNMIARTSGPPAGAVGAVREAIRRVAPEAPVVEVNTMEEQINNSLLQERLLATLGTFFGLLGLLLSGIGIYGIVAYSVAGRTREIGIRLALGAKAEQIVWMVVRSSTIAIASGAVLGIGLSLAMSKWLRSFLYGLAPQDPLTIAISVLVLLAGAVVAAYVPTRRATRIEATQALKYE